MHLMSMNSHLQLVTKHVCVQIIAFLAMLPRHT